MNDTAYMNIPYLTGIPDLVGVGWLPFAKTDLDDATDGTSNFSELSWMRFRVTDGPTPTMEITAIVYDDAGADVTLAEAVAAAPIPEPSSLALLALGSVGLAARRQRKKAA